MMKPMSDKDVDNIIRNEAEWRRHMLRKIESIENEQKQLLITVTTLKVKVGLAASLFGTMGGGLVSLLLKAKGG